MTFNSSLSELPKVTVIIPNYNHCKFLEQRFSSIFQQTFQDFEIIFLDDLSTDNSLEIFKKVSGHPKVVKSILNEKNSGSPYIQWNRGAREARGEYIWIAESDDYAHPEFLERMVDALDANPSVGIAFCQSNKVDEFSNIFGSTEDWTSELGKDRWARDFTAHGRNECGSFLIRKCMIPNVSSALIRREVLQKVGYAHEAMRYCGDYLTYTKILEVSDLAYVSRALNYFRFSKNTMRTKMSHSWLHEYERAVVMDYVNEKYPISQRERDAASAQYIEKLIRLSAQDWRFAVSWLTRIRLFHEPVSKFCPRFELKILSTGLKLAAKAIRSV